MFGYEKKKFFINWLIVLAVLLVGAASAFGYNSLKGTFDLFAGIGVIGEMFGGIASLGAIAGVILAVGIIVGGLIYMGRKDYTGKTGLFAFHVILGFAVVAAAAFIGIRWIVWPTDGWTSLGLGLGALILVTAATAAVTHRTK